MPTKNPRVITTLEPPLYEWVNKTAKSDGISISLKLRDIIRHAYEDTYWSKVGEGSLSSFDKKEVIEHSPSLSETLIKLGAPRTPPANWNSLEELRKCRERDTH
jgi:hypothetical protein